MLMQLSAESVGLLQTQSHLICRAHTYWNSNVLLLLNAQVCSVLCRAKLVFVIKNCKYEGNLLNAQVCSVLCRTKLVFVIKNCQYEGNLTTLNNSNKHNLTPCTLLLSHKARFFF